MPLFQNVLKPSYWFDVHALPFGRTALWAFLAWVGLFVIVTVVLRYRANGAKSNPPLTRFLRRLSHGALLYVVLSLLFLFFRMEGALVIGMRAWYVLMTILFGWWKLHAVLAFRRRYAGEQRAHQDRVRAAQYFPQRKK